MIAFTGCSWTWWWRRRLTKTPDPSAALRRCVDTTGFRGKALLLLLRAERFENSLYQRTPGRYPPPVVPFKELSAEVERLTKENYRFRRERRVDQALLLGFVDDCS